MTMIIKTQFRVRYSETDGQRRAHHSHYPIWFEMGRADFCRDAGFNYRQMEDDGLYLVVAKLECLYKAPLEYDDLVTVETGLSSISRKLMTFEYRIINESASGTLAGKGRTVLVCVDRDGRPTALVPETLASLSNRLEPTFFRTNQ